MKHQLEFEKPIFELQRKLDELKKHPEKHSMGINLDQEIQLMEVKLEETRKQIYLNLTPWQRVMLARHPKRPYTLDYFQSVFTDFSELHGDRLFSDDRAMVAGFAKLAGRPVMVSGDFAGAFLSEQAANSVTSSTGHLPAGGSPRGTRVFVWAALPGQGLFPHRCAHAPRHQWRAGRIARRRPRPGPK